MLLEDRRADGQVDIQTGGLRLILNPLWQSIKSLTNY